MPSAVRGLSVLTPGRAVCRTLPGKYLEEIAGQIRTHSINALLIIGGFEVRPLAVHLRARRGPWSAGWGGPGPCGHRVLVVPPWVASPAPAMQLHRGARAAPPPPSVRVTHPGSAETMVPLESQRAGHVAVVVLITCRTTFYFIPGKTGPTITFPFALKREASPNEAVASGSLALTDCRSR